MSPVILTCQRIGNLLFCRNLRGARNPETLKSFNENTVRRGSTTGVLRTHSSMRQHRRFVSQKSASSSFARLGAPACKIKPAYMF